MQRQSINFHSRIILVVLLLAMSAVAGAQNASQSSAPMQAILERLDQLEKDNQALLDQVRALRQEISTLQTPGTASPASPSAASSDSTQAASTEQQAVVDTRVDELAQTKVEASQKFPIRISGMALFNASLNGRFNGDFENPLIASWAPGQTTGGGTLRQSTLGILFNGPETFAGGKISGSLYMDFFGGSTLAINHLIRLRTAAINVDWKNTSLMFGQDKPLISPRDPNSFAQVGYSPLSGAGNLWLWLPQARLEQRFSLGENTGLRAQASVIGTSSLDYPSDPYAYVAPPSPQQEYSWPGAEGRLELWHHWGNTNRIELGGGYHFNQNRIIESRVPTEIYSFDWFLRPIPKLEFSGAVFHGENVATLGSLPQGFMLQTYEGNITSVTTVHSTGGWAQIRIPITERLAWDVYGGQQDDRNSDLSFGFISKNQGYFSNLMYRIAPNVIVSFEGGQLRTTYVGMGTRLNDHYDLAVAYLF